MGCIFCVEEDIPMNPTQVDLTHFKLHRVLGKGGFGKVNCVEHRVSGAMYALKAIEKALLVQKDYVADDNVRATWLEREVMSKFTSNFLVHLYYAFQDEYNLYMVMHFMKGGDLRYHLTQHRHMSEDRTRFYIAEILLGLEEMHSLGIVYRDLKPENCLLDEEGHVRLSDFGLSHRLDLEEDGKTSGNCGTSGYMAPEMLAGFAYDTSVDIYSLGVIMYEFLHDRLPDVSEGVAHLSMRSDLSDECQDLLMGLLEVIPENRLGCTTKHKIEEVKMHPWFRNIQWDAAARKELRPPFVPQTNVANCDPTFELEEQLMETPLPQRVTPEQDAQFIGWEYHVAINDDDPHSLASSERSQIRRMSGSLAHLIQGTSLALNAASFDRRLHGDRDRGKNSDKEFESIHLDSKLQQGTELEMEDVQVIDMTDQDMGITTGRIKELSDNGDSNSDSEQYD